MTSLEVRATRYDLSRLRLVQALVPFAVIMSPIARRFQSALVLIPTALIGIAVMGAFFSARKSAVTRLSASGRRIALGPTKVEASQWRWHGHKATLFAAGSNVVIKPRASTDAEALRSVLQSALGPPLRYRRRGSPRARVISLVVALVGVVLVAIGLINDLVYLVPAVLLVIFGFAFLGALSGSVPDTRPSD